MSYQNKPTYGSKKSFPNITPLLFWSMIAVMSMGALIVYVLGAV